MTIPHAISRIRAGTLTPRQLLDECLTAIHVHEPTIGAWAFVDEHSAIEVANERTRQAARGEFVGPLHGIPLGIKDIIDVANMTTSCGIDAWTTRVAIADAPAVSRLRAAGAIILGKTVTTPFAFLDPPRTRHPFHHDRTPGGSSSGSAAAVALKMCMGALGTQTGGSLTRPASYCGVASIKPTFGKLPLDGVMPLSATLDHLGVMAPSVAGLQILYGVLLGQPPAPATDTPVSLIELRGEFLSIAEPRLMVAFRDAMAKLEQNRISISVVEEPDWFAEVRQSHSTLIAHGAAQTHRARFHDEPELFGPNIRDLIERGLQISDATADTALSVRNELIIKAEQLLPANTMFITPASTDFAPGVATTGNPAFNSPWSCLGLPTISVPAGWSADGLPHAVQLIGRRDAEAELFQIAARLEAIFAFRLPSSV